MKTDVKSKTDVLKTGNKPICLKDWEKLLLKLFNAEANPSFTRVEGGLSVGVAQKKTSKTAATGSVESDDQGQVASTRKSGASKRSRPIDIDALIPPKPEKTQKSSLSSETEETAKLTTQELQRLVLVEQLKLVRMQLQRIQATTPIIHSDTE
ncbi:uncharacterized protein LOC135497575 [Lineus longissimus]|uniref:uncharacterized protein LOC135497575 n=1 Tax=Lineus longissimus TaxID=88925 RepID=UPI00315DAFC5